MSSQSSFITLVDSSSLYLDEFSRVAGDLVQKGWAEANAGNFSRRIPDIPDFPGSTYPLPVPHAGLSNQALLIKVAGTRMRDLARDPVPGLCLLRLNSDGSAYRLLGESLPSSELPTHLAVHEVLAEHRPHQKSLLHTHPAALAALSLLYPEPESLVALLLRAHAEMLPLQGRIHALPSMAPGTEVLASATARAFEQWSGVIWARHGMITSGTDLWQALDLTEVCEKAASICILAGSAAPLVAGLKVFDASS